MDGGIEREVSLKTHFKVILYTITEVITGNQMDYTKQTFLEGCFKVLPALDC